MSAPAYTIGDQTTPLLQETIGQNLESMVARFPDRDALVSMHQGIRETYREFDKSVDLLAMGLLRLGLEVGDRVGIWSPNCAEWVWLQYATAK
ncbi:MAG: AMP-binding protein, partial [bacterium]|nr:AMP-binding protein [bacterium]